MTVLVILCSYQGVNKLSIISTRFINVKRNYLKHYLIGEVRRLEQFASSRNSWGERPDIINILTKLLCNGKAIIFNGEMLPKLEDKFVESPFFSLDELENYSHEFIKQTSEFAQGGVGHKPRVRVENEEMYRVKEVKTLYFLNAQTDAELLASLKRVETISKDLDTYLKTANFARREILLKLLKPTIYPLLVTIEQMYEALT